jgi:hypothetical protein
MAEYQSLSDDQRRSFIDSLQLYEANEAALHAASSFRRGMYWKTVKGSEYLVRTIGSNGEMKSLGPRSLETEKIYEAFVSGRANSRERLERLSARFNKAARIARVPVIAARILSSLEEAGLLGEKVIIVGTNALFAYEAAAGVRFDSELMATNDIDVLWDVRSQLALLGPADGAKSLLKILKSADRSFEVSGRKTYRAVNDDGYMVDFIKRVPRPALRAETKKLHGDDVMSAAEIEGLDWLLNSEKLEQVVIAEDGTPVRMVVPDPCAFALHKSWLSNRNDREPVKKTRDWSQAKAVWALVEDYLPRWHMDKNRLKALPASVHKHAKRISAAVADERIEFAIANQGSKAFTTQSGPILTLLTRFAEKGDLPSISRAFVRFAQAMPANSEFVANAMPAKITNYLIAHQGIDPVALMRWSKDNPGWTAELKDMLEDPALFEPFVQHIAVAIKNVDAR